MRLGNQFRLGTYQESFRLIIRLRNSWTISFFNQAYKTYEKSCCFW